MQKMILVDQAKCTGCRLCELVCAVKNERVSNPARARIHIIKWDRDGFYLPMVCQQCEEAPCIAVCPVGALSIDEELNRVVVAYDKCIRCKLCVTACPFGSMGYDTIGKKVIKCEMCEGDPVCVRFCDPGAITYVDANTANLHKARSAGEKLQETLKKLSV